MAQHSYGGKPPPPVARPAFTSSTSNSVFAPSETPNNHNGNGGWFKEITGAPKPKSPPPSSIYPTRKLGGW